MIGEKQGIIDYSNYNSLQLNDHPVANLDHKFIIWPLQRNLSKSTHTQFPPHAEKPPKHSMLSINNIREKAVTFLSSPTEEACLHKWNLCSFRFCIVCNSLFETRNYRFYNSLFQIRNYNSIIPWLKSWNFCSYLPK